jgi:hypothetical protein
VPKRRQPASANVANIEDKIEQFGSGADADPTPEPVANEPDPNAKRDFKAIRVGLNEYEYQVLSEAAAGTGRSKLGYIRWAIREYAKSVQN